MKAAVGSGDPSPSPERDGSRPGGPRGGTRGLRDLAIAIAAGALVWSLDHATGAHLQGALGALASRLGGWYEERRVPAVLCMPGKPAPYTGIDGVVLDVPPCWKSEITSLLGQAIHRFYDPDARAGIVSISVEPAESDDDVAALRAEFARLAAAPGAIVDGQRTRTAVQDGGASVATGGVATPTDQHEITSSIASRLVDDAGGAAAGAVGSAPPAPSTGYGSKMPAPSGGAPAATPARAPEEAGSGTPPGASRSRSFRSVEVGMLLAPAAARSGADDGSGLSSIPPTDSGHPRHQWSWLLLSDRIALRVTYEVRDDWAETSIVAKEVQRVRALVASARTGP